MEEKKQETIQLSIDTGSVLIEITDNGEHIGQFRFNPNDLDIVKRYDKVVEALDSIQIPENADIDSVFAVTEELKKQMGYLLNYNVSEEIFAKCNPLTLTESGNFYIENVIDGIVGLIEEKSEQRLKKKKARIQKATAEYHK